MIERAIETAARMLGSDKSRGYCLGMICADFLAGASLDEQNPEILVSHLTALRPVLAAITKAETKHLTIVLRATEIVMCHEPVRTLLPMRDA